VKLASKA